MTPEQEHSPSAAPQPVLTVAAVARRLGVAPSTLRTWDRRYGLGPSAHTAGSHRRYGPDDLHRLSVMRGLTLEGVPPAEAAQIALGSPVGDRSGSHQDGDHRFSDDLVADSLGAPLVGAPPEGAGSFPGPVVPRPGRSVEPPGLLGPDRFDPDRGPLLGDPPFLRLDLPDDPEVSGGPEFTVSDPAGVERAGSLFGFAGFAGPAMLPGGDVVPEPGRGAAVWITDEPLPGAPRTVPPAEALGPAGALGQAAALPDRLLGAQALLGPVGAPGSVAPGRAGGGRVLSLPDATPRARGLARAAMALDTFELQRLLRDAIAAYGVVGTWDSMVVPVLAGLGERWRTTGEAVDVEHAFSEAVLAALRGVTLMLRRPRNPVPVLLACSDGDLHSLPLHVMAAALAEEEVGCRMLGAGLPSPALVSAVRRTGPALVFLYARMPVQEAAVLRELPRQRPAPRVLLGGPGWDGVRRPATISHVSTLPEALSAVLSAARR